MPVTLMARVLVRGTALGGTVVLALAASIWLIGTFLLRPAPAAVGPPPAGAVPVSFSSPSGSELRGWSFPRAQPQGVVVLMHGVRGHRGNMVGRARLVNQLGYAALAFDFQAHGESPGDRITFGDRESRDAAAAVAFARTRWPDLPVFAIGVSLGGAAALLASPPLAVDGLVLEAVYADIESAIANRLDMRIPFASVATPLFTLQMEPRLGFAPERLSPVRAAAAIRAPVLLLAGTLDRRTTTEDTWRLYAAFQGGKRILWFEGAAHVDLERHASQRYARAIEHFLAGARSR